MWIWLDVRPRCALCLPYGAPVGSQLRASWNSWEFYTGVELKVLEGLSALWLRQVMAAVVLWERLCNQRRRLKRALLKLAADTVARAWQTLFDHYVESEQVESRSMQLALRSCARFRHYDLSRGFQAFVERLLWFEHREQAMLRMLHPKVRVSLVTWFRRAAPLSWRRIAPVLLAIRPSHPDGLVILCVA